jgi:cytochrome c peroxidase
MKALITIFALMTLCLPLGATTSSAPLSLSKSLLLIEEEIDGPSGSEQIQLSVGSSADYWETRTDAAWLQVAPMGGRGSGSISVRVKPDALPPGQYSANLYFRASRFPQEIQTIQVRYTLHSAQGSSVYAGDQQVAAIGRELAAPLVARVTDRTGSPVAGATVRFETVVGSTHPASSSVVTDVEGLASFQPRALQYGAVEILASAEGKQDKPARFRAVVTGWLSEFAGDGIRAYGGDDGPASRAQLNAPFGMALQQGQLLVVDYFNHALRAIDLASGYITALAGNGKQGFNGDGLPPADTLLSGPFGIALGPSGDIIFSDYYNNRIRSINREAGTIETIAGVGTVGYTGDGGPAVAASIDVPLDIAADSRGNVYLSDWHHHVVRRIDARSGRIETIAGVGARTYNGEGVAVESALAVPLGLSFDRDDNLYIADYGNNRVRKIDAVTGVISTVAGSGQLGFSGDGEQAIFARLNRPYNVYADDDGGLFISDAGNHRIRHVDLASGVITTVAGDGRFGYSAGNGLATQAMFKGPFSVIKDDRQNLYVAEYFGQRVRKVGPQRIAIPPGEKRIDRLQRQSRQLFGQLPVAAEAEENPLSASKIALGRSLFHEAALSKDGSVSCSTCHPLDNYGMDGVPLAVGIDDRLGDRNSPSVFNAALQDSQFWDGRVATVEAQVREPLLNPKEMAMPDEAAVVAAVKAVPAYRAEFARIFPTAEEAVNMENISLAVGAFQRGLMTGDAPFDKFIAGDKNALSARQLQGLEVFLREDCASCHAGPLLGGQDLHLIEDYPTSRAGDQFEFRKRMGNTHKFKVAPLRNIARTAPYLHDGRYSTLEESLGDRLLAYMVREANIRETVDLAEGELEALVGFLQSLTGVVDEEYAQQ